MTKKSLLRKPEFRWRSWLIAAAIAAVALLGALSIDLEGVYAEEYEGTVYFNLSDDGLPVVSDVTGEAMMMVPVSLQDVADVDLAEWGYEDYAYTEYGGDGTPDPERPTALKLYLYMHEHYKNDPQNSITVTQSPQSAYMPIFWGLDENLNYYVNGAYPLFEAGWGATCDAIALEDGDRVDVMHFSDWSFWGDSKAGFNFFADAEKDPEDGAIVDSYIANADVPLHVQVIRGYGNLMIGGATEYQAADDLNLHVSAKNCPLDLGDDCVATLDGGMAELTFSEPGTYYIWVEGGEGDSSVVQSAAAATVHVHDWGEAAYTWNDDNTKVTAKRVCSIDPKHVEQETVNTTSEQTKAPDCETMGETTYTAQFENAAFATQTKTLEDVDALGHDPSELEESKEATYSEGAYHCTVTSCTVCGQELSRGEKIYTSDSLKKQAEDALAEANDALEAAQEAQTAADNAQKDADDALLAAQAASEEVPNHIAEEALTYAQAAADAAEEAQTAAQAAQEKAADAVEAAQKAQEKAAEAVEAAQAAQEKAATDEEIADAATAVTAAETAAEAATTAAADAENAVTAAQVAADNADAQREYADADLDLAAYEVDSIMDEKTNAVVTFAQIAPLANEEAYTKASYDEYAAMVDAFNEAIESNTVSAREVKAALYNVTLAFHNLVAKSPQVLTAATKDAATDYAALGKAAKTFNVVTVSGNAGNLSYSLAEGSTAGLSIDPESGAVTVAKGKNAGTYNAIITVDAAMTDDFSAASATVKAKITVAKVKQTMTVKAKARTVKAAKLKKAKQTVKGAVTVKNAKGKVTYAKKSGSGKLTISKKGVVTVRKGTKKGTYKIKVNVKAAGNVNFKAATKTVNVTVKVK